MAASQALLLIILVRGADSRAAADLVIAMAIAAPLVIVFKGQYRNILVMGATEYSVRQLLDARLIAFPAFLFMATGSALLVRADTTRILTVLLVIVTKGIDSIASLLHGELQRSSQLASIARLLATRAIVVTGAVGLLIWATPSLSPFWPVLLLTSSTATLVLADWRAVRPLLGPVQPGRRLYAAWVINRRYWSLGFAGAAFAFIPQVPKFAIDRFGDDVAITAFGFASYILVGFGLLINAYGVDVAPRVASIVRAKSFTVPLARELAIALLLSLFFAGAAGVAWSVLGSLVAEYLGIVIPSTFVWAMVAAVPPMALVTLLRVVAQALGWWHEQIRYGPPLAIVAVLGAGTIVQIASTATPLAWLTPALLMVDTVGMALVIMRILNRRHELQKRA